MSDIWDQVLTGAANSSSLELIAVIFGLLSVWFARKENILVFPTGIVNVGIYIYICAAFKLYADMSINAYYLVMSVYGWVVWSRKNDNLAAIRITNLASREWFLYVGITLISFVIIYWTLVNFTDSDVPLWDSFTTSFFIVAMMLMARKKIEHWMAWIIGDIISIPLYLYKGLAFTAVQYLVFTIIAVAGLIEWQKRMEK